MKIRPLALALSAALAAAYPSTSQALAARPVRALSASRPASAAARGAVLAAPLAARAFAASPLPAALPAAVLPRVAARPPQPSAHRTEGTDSPASALSSLTVGARGAALAARGDAAGPKVRAALDGAFEARVRRGGTGAVLAVAPRSGPAVLAASSRDRAGRRASDPAAPGIGPNPKGSWAKSLALATVVTIFTFMAQDIVQTTALLSGWVPHPSYTIPLDFILPSLQAFGLTSNPLGFLLGAAVIAPIAEEVLFRGVLQGSLSMAAGRLGAGRFLLPAVITSVLFVAIHETADPVFMLTRFIGAMSLSWLAYRHGLPSSMLAHGIFNGSMALPLVLGVLTFPGGGEAAAIAAMAYATAGVWILGALALLWAAQHLIFKGKSVAAARLRPRQAALLAAAVWAGFFFLGPLDLWLAGAIVLTLWPLSYLMAATRP